MSVRTKAVLGAHLGEARRAGTRRAMRIQVPCVATGALGQIIAACLAVLPPVPYSSIGTSVRLCSLLVLLLAVLPTQPIVVKAVAVTFAALATIHSLTVLVTSTVGFEEEDTPFRQWHQWGTMAVTVVGNAVYISASCRLLCHLLRGASPLVLLRAMWKSLAVCCFVMCLCNVLLVALNAVFCGVYEVAWVAAAMEFCTGTAVAILALRSEFRAYCQAWLAGCFRKEDTAAGLAALLGKMSATEVEQTAESSFCCVTLDRVSREDMAASKPNACLHKLTQPAALGDVDAFLTHSWHDHPEEKWEALQQWRETFKAQHGREPRVWIDKYCIDQRHIDESLASLPVFLAGCSKLVVLPGHTYTSRLWCVIEILTFISMGGQVEDIVSVPFRSFAMDWSTFDMKHASCFRRSDTDRLLAVVEGFSGTKELFNRRVRTLFAASPAFEPSYAPRDFI